ncbi:MAG: hypothetical protein ACI93R_002749 [Flavobacteriales bacterium]|jgi:hypothetical protein
MKTFLMILTAVFLSACGSSGPIKDFSCESSNWTELGYEVAMSGKSVRYLDEYKKLCGAKVTEAAIEQYIGGYTLGVIEYCTHENGYEIGLTGDAIPTVCPYEYREVFIDGYYQGRSKRERDISTLGNHAQESVDAARDVGPGPAAEAPF